MGFRHQRLGELIANELRSPSGHYCVEAHIVAPSFWSDLAALRLTHFAARCPVVVSEIRGIRTPSLPPSSQASAGAPDGIGGLGVRIPLATVVRVREPYSWYRSFYDWGVLGRQRGGDATYGANFTDWLPRNVGREAV